MNLQPETLDRTLPTGFVRQFMEFGFVILPGAVSARRLAEISVAYDELMVSGSGPDFKVGSTTTRLYFVDSRVTFEDVYRYPRLLEFSARRIAQPFKLSSLLGRTLRAGSPAQKLHTDISRNCAHAPMAGFILMLDPFTPRNGATRFIPDFRIGQMFHRIDSLIRVWNAKARFWHVEMLVP